ncbi:hypothetical protein [Sulfurisphaera ohwakuensis]|nr:hypothetical protein [Sulfurisphaera ohwakuensis]MBB5254888.1 ABC-type multidrug transport system permease subunit [Sulfurisphaera ohwakuensis]
MGIAYLIVKVFYPPTSFSIIPIVSLIESPALGVIQLILLGLMVAFAYPVRTKIEGNSLMVVRKLAIIVAVGYLVFSLLPAAFRVPYIQTYIGLIIAANVLNGTFAGIVSSII